MVGFVRICSCASCVNVSSWSLPFVLGKAASRAASARSRVDDLSWLMSSSIDILLSETSLVATVFATASSSRSQVSLRGIVGIVPIDVRALTRPDELETCEDAAPRR